MGIYTYIYIYTYYRHTYIHILYFIILYYIILYCIILYYIYFLKFIYKYYIYIIFYYYKYRYIIYKYIIYIIYNGYVMGLTTIPMDPAVVSDIMVIWVHNGHIIDIHTCMHTHIHTYTHTPIHTYIHIYYLSCFVTRVLALSTRVPALACSALTPMHFSRCAS